MNCSSCLSVINARERGQTSVLHDVLHQAQEQRSTRFALMISGLWAQVKMTIISATLGGGPVWRNMTMPEWFARWKHICFKASVSELVMDRQFFDTSFMRRCSGSSADLYFCVVSLFQLAPRVTSGPAFLHLRICAVKYSMKLKPSTNSCVTSAPLKALKKCPSELSSLHRPCLAFVSLCAEPAAKPSVGDVGRGGRFYVRCRGTAWRQW